MAKRDADLVTQLVDIARQMAEEQRPRPAVRQRPGPKPSGRRIDWERDRKWCPHCEETKPVGEFGRVTRGRYERVQPWCSACRGTTSENYRRGRM